MNQNQLASSDVYKKILDEYYTYLENQIKMANTGDIAAGSAAKLHYITFLEYIYFFAANLEELDIIKYLNDINKNNAK